MDSLNFRGIKIPFVRMGAVSSDDLFEQREQELFDFYEQQRGRYGRVLDVGANIGVHTIIMAKLGWFVTSFEPDPVHYEMLLKNVALNRAEKQVQVRRSALSTSDGLADFVRVLGNTTASHLAGARKFHGDAIRFLVQREKCDIFFVGAHFAKIDVEGHEAELLCASRPEHRCEFMVEVSSAENASRIYRHFESLGRSMWAQSRGWARVRSIADVPAHYREGSLFIGEKPCGKS